MSVKDHQFWNTRRSERGAALVAVLFISLLLGTACVMLLSGVSASSKNKTDALSENKAYYAAESGLQAGINFFRNDTTVSGNTKYSYAVSHPLLDTKLSYATINGISQVAVGGESGYSLNITDPDNSNGAIVYSTSGSFDQGNGTYAPTRVYGTGANTLTFSFNPQGSTTANHPINDGQPFGSVQVVKSGTGSLMPGALSFKIDYVMAEPRPATRTIRGSISASGDITITPPTPLMESVITLCSLNQSSGCPSFAQAKISSPFPPSDLLPRTATVYAKMTAIEPYRLKVLARGYGPNNSTKQLEAVIQRNFFNHLGSATAIAMIGPNAQFSISGNTSVAGGSVPSVTFSDLSGLNYANAHTSGSSSLTPAPELAGNDVPDWQRSPAAMDAFVQQLKQAAQNSGRYYGPGQTPSNYGDYDDGTGITFMDRDCSMSGNTEGGGILVITGNLTTSGNTDFKGLILVLGSGGVTRSGNSSLLGNLVIAPYNPNDLGAGWGTPIYDASGTSGVGYNDVYVDQAFDGTMAITDFVLGVAEK